MWSGLAAAAASAVGRCVNISRALGGDDAAAGRTSAIRSLNALLVGPGGANGAAAVVLVRSALAGTERDRGGRVAG